MTFTGNEDHSITLEEAAKLTANHRKSAGETAVKAGFIGKDTVQKILDQEHCVGIRIYFGETADGTPEPVLVGVNADGKDIIDGTIAEKLLPCPPYCDDSSPLNS